MPVEFKNFSVNDHGRALTVENAFRFYCAYAGLHDFLFNALYEQNASGWNQDTGLTGTIAADTLTLSSPTTWTKVRQITPLPADHTVYFTSEGEDYYQGVVVGSLSSTNYWLVCQEGEGVWKVYKGKGDGTLTLKQSTTVDYDTQGGDFACTFRSFATGDQEDDLWMSITLWRNDRHLLTYTQKLNNPLTGPYFVGFAAYSTAERVYSNIRVPELCVYAEYGTLDPGETPIGGLERAIEGRYLKYFVRHDATVRAFRPKSRSIDVEVDEDYVESRSLMTDLRVMKSHVRMMGAYDWGEAMDTDLVAQIGHRFVEVSNPMLMSEAECIVEAKRHLRRLNAYAHTADLDTVNLPLVELEDRLDDSEGSWIVDSYAKTFTQGAIFASYHLRKYLPNS